MLKRWFVALASAVPPLLVVAVIAGVAFWGHATEWKAPKFDELSGSVVGLVTNGEWKPPTSANPAEDKDKPADGPTKEKAPGPPDWCVRHGVHDSLCTACHPEIVASTYLSSAMAGLAIRRSHEPQECRTHLEVIKFPSLESLKNSGVKVDPAREQTLTDTVTAYGEIDYDPDHTFKLSARTMGTVWRVQKHLGDRVRAGEVMALIDSADIGRAKAEYLQAVVQHDTRARALTLLQSGSPSERLRQEAESAVREAKARLFTARQALLNFGLPLTGDEASLPDDQLEKRLRFLGIPSEIVSSLQTDTTTANLLALVAPRGGIIIERNIEAGETVAALHPLFVVSNIDEVHAHVDFRPEDVLRVAPGARVDFKPDSDDRTYTGHLHTITTALNEKTRLVHAHAHMHNPDGRLRAHLFGTATITVATHEKAVVVPADAVQWEGCSHVVFVCDPSDPLVFRPRKVVTGLRQNGVVEVLVGLRPGESVATAGSHVLKSYLFRDRLGAGEG